MFRVLGLRGFRVFRVYSKSGAFLEPVKTDWREGITTSPRRPENS